MELILTHDNADFDAVASQLAAHKLMPGAIPVLPSRINRNVRHFTALYWDELPYAHAKDLPKEPVERVVVVDTQTVQSVRGMGDDTPVAIIDHHAPRESLNPAWQVTLEPVGATTTILTERIRAEGISLSPVEATALLLGVYEDTGSLTYGTATPRDAYAAAWLLDQGALLDVVRDFLEHPLSDDQIAVFERLQENARIYDIQGHPVVVASAHAPGLVEEIATLAHKLRDLLDPDGTFVLVDLGQHVQLVARSVGDAIDVGRIAEHFGGGGHGRASAAIIRDMTLEEAEETLLDLLRGQIRPSLTVADLMSRGVQTLPPDARARDAAGRMRRYGYEGFPIVQEGRIVGLLTRRAVDRALDHGLSGVRVDQLMEAGEVAVRPTDSIAALQHVMMTTGWGQVPVVDDSGRIAGVVTRTDLIKHMGHDTPANTRRSEVARLLEDALPPLLMALVREIGRIAQQMDVNLYAVGGFVRDLLLDHHNIDIDFVAEGDAIALTRALRAEFGGDLRSHRRFGTGKWLLNDDTWRRVADRLGFPPSALDELPPHLDFATARTEFYDAPTVLPEIERSSIKHDVHRRDFTINTLAIRLDPRHFGQLLDFYGGEVDLHRGRIRVLHSLSFVDDPTRILRAIRFEQRLGFTIEARTAELIQHAIPMLDRVSGDRVKHELELIFDEAQPERVLRRLDELGGLAHLHPDLRADDWLFAAYRALRAALARPLWPELASLDPELPYFALFTHRLPRAATLQVCRRLHVRRRTVDTLAAVSRLAAEMGLLDGPIRPSQLDRLLRKASDDALVTLWAAASTASTRDHLADYATRLRFVSPTIGGDALKERGLKPGPAYTHILAALRTAWLDGDVTTPAEEAALLDRLLAEELS